jgi:hypothetical protein
MITMNDDSALAEYEAESESAQSVPDDTQNTDFTQVACCAFTDEPEKPGSRQARADLINDSTAAEEEQPFSLKHFFSRLLGLK